MKVNSFSKLISQVEFLGKFSIKLNFEVFHAQQNLLHGSQGLPQGDQFSEIRQALKGPGRQKHHSPQEKAAPGGGEAPLRGEGQHQLHPPQLRAPGGG